MKMNKVKLKVCILILFLLLFPSWNIFAQNQNQENDSIVITNIANNFFNWYITVAKEKKYIEFQPQFVQSKSSMTTLDYSIYIQILTNYSFSDSLIEIEKQSYQECIKNLEKVNYSDFIEKWVNLGDYISTGCDFNNYYRWTGGQEMYDGYTVSNIHIKKKYAVVEGIIFDKDFENKDKINVMRNISMTFILQDNVWKITGIKY